MTASGDRAKLRLATEYPGGAHLGAAALRSLGVSRRALADCMDRGLLVRSGRGLYEVPNTAAEDEWRRTVRRSVARSGVGAAAARFTAARLHELSGAPVACPVFVTIPRSRSKPRLPGVDLTRSDIPPEDHVLLDDIASTSALRTALDCVRFGERVAAVCVVESGARLGRFTLDDVTERLAALGQSPGTRAGRLALGLADLRSESPLETALRLLLLDAGLPHPEPQYPFALESIWGRIDLAYPGAQLGAKPHGRYVGLAIEADGRTPRETAATFHHDRVRHTALEEAGWLVRRFTDRAIRRTPREVVLGVRRALAAVVAG